MKAKSVKDEIQLTTYSLERRVYGVGRSGMEEEKRRRKKAAKNGVEEWRSLELQNPLEF